MSWLVKLGKAFLGLLLFVFYTRKFPVQIFRGKRIAIVGPANSAYNTGNGAFIDSFDLVVRINKAPALLKEGNSKVDIGTRIDILFHSFFENEFSGGGTLDFELFDQLKISYVVNPITTFAGKRVSFNFYKKYLLRRITYFPANTWTQEQIGAFGKHKPTTGFCALKILLESACEEVFVTGFTFFKTPYGVGYRDPLRDVTTNRNYIKESGIHNPDVEYELFKLLIKTNSEKIVRTDAVLKSILEEDGIIVVGVHDQK